MKTIGVVSDTHIPSRARGVPAEVMAALVGVDLVLHAGDLTRLDVIHTLARLAPVEAVYGNVDPDGVVAALAARRVIEVEGMRIGLVHGHEGRGRSTWERALNAFEDDNVQCVVFGHTHIPLCRTQAGILLFNPGSCTDRRTQPRRSLGRLFVDGAKIRGEITYL